MSRIIIPKRGRGARGFRHAEINKILSPLINYSATFSEIENKRRMEKESEENGFCFTSKDYYKKFALVPRSALKTLSVEFTEVLGNLSILSAFKGSREQVDRLPYREIMFSTRFPGISACYFEQWLDEGENNILSKMYLHLYYIQDRESSPVQFLALHSDPDLIDPYPMYNGITHFHVGTDILSNMHIVSAITSGSSTFDSAAECDRSFSLAVMQICKEFEREKLNPLVIR